MKGKNVQPRILYPARLCFRFDGEIKSFPDKQKLREFSTTKPALWQMLKELTKGEENTWEEEKKGNTRKGKDRQKIIPKQENRNRIVHINVCLCVCVCMCMCVCMRAHALSLSDVGFFVTPWTIACQAPLSMGLSRQEYWSGLPFPTPGDLPDPGIKPTSPALAGKIFTTVLPGKPQ